MSASTDLFDVQISRNLVPEINQALITPARSLGTDVEFLKEVLAELLASYVNRGMLPPDCTLKNRTPDGPIYAFTFAGVQLGFRIDTTRYKIKIVGVLA